MSHLFNALDAREPVTKRPVADLDRIVEVVCNHFQVNEEDILHGTQSMARRNPARAITMYLCQKIGQMSLTEIAQIFDLKSYSSAAATIRSARQKMAADSELNEIVNGILLDLAV